MKSLGTLIASLYQAYKYSCNLRNTSEQGVHIRGKTASTCNLLELLQELFNIELRPINVVWPMLARVDMKTLLQLEQENY
jgi:phosphoglycerate-specific signal transduction histidine kinase